MKHKETVKVQHTHTFEIEYNDEAGRNGALASLKDPTLLTSTCGSHEVVRTGVTFAITKQRETPIESKPLQTSGDLA